MGGAPKITLYGPTEIPFTEKVRLALLYKGLEFAITEPTGPEDYRRWNPEFGLLPVLDLDGERIPDSTAILLKLDEVFPEPPLLSTDPRIGSQQRQLEDWADENLLFYFNRWIRIRDAHQAGDGSPGSSDGIPPWRRWLRRLGAWLSAGGTWERPETGVLRGISDRLDDLVGFLGTRPFFYSDRVSMADLSVYAMLHSLSSDTIPGAQRIVVSRTPLVEFMRRVESATAGSAAPA
ncbi:MAG: glutathione S-transferase N-terminal domain-containing protein [Myxococcota bacterium]